MCAINRVNRLISTPSSSPPSPPSSSLPLLVPPSSRSCLQPGFEEINPEWKTSLERRKKIKGSRGREAPERADFVADTAAPRRIRFSDL